MEKERTTAASKALLNSGTRDRPSGREYHATSAELLPLDTGPWARPVEFKMKEVNRRVGGLYSMFVKGALRATRQPEPPTKNAESSAAASAADASFSWKKAMRNALRAAPQRQLKVKALRKVVLAEYGKSHPGVDDEAARSSFKERLKKDTNIVKEGKLVRLK